MKQEMRLDQIGVGDCAVVYKLENEKEMRRRLQDIGLIEGTVVECIGKSPGGDPHAYLIRGAVIAIRAEDAERITVIPCPRGVVKPWD